MAERAFKGIWIPAEIWLYKNLTALDKIIWAEINSLDNEQGCTATNKYLAEFCGCSVTAVSNAVTKLQELQLVEVWQVEGRGRVIRASQNLKDTLTNFVRDPYKNCEGPLQILKGSDPDTLYKEKSKEKNNEKSKERKGDAVASLVSAFSDNEEVRKAIRDFIEHRKTIKKPMNELALERMLATLAKIGSTDQERIAILDKSIERGWAGIFPLKDEDKQQAPAPARPTYQRKPNFFTDYTHQSTYDWDAIQRELEENPTLKFS